MVSVAVSKLGCTGLIFVEPGVQVNGAYYRDVLLQKMLPAIRSITGELFIFQQDSALAHRARETVSLLERETPRFIGPDLWPPNSTDLNPVDYKVWGVMQECVYKLPIKDVSELKQRLIEAWSAMQQCASTKPSTNGINAFAFASQLKADTLNISCKITNKHIAILTDFTQHVHFTTDIDCC